jgi:hypothetical protein
MASRTALQTTAIRTLLSPRTSQLPFVASQAVGVAARRQPEYEFRRHFQSAARKIGGEGLPGRVEVGFAQSRWHSTAHQKSKVYEFDDVCLSFLSPTNYYYIPIISPSTPVQLHVLQSLPVHPANPSKTGPRHPRNTIRLAPPHRRPRAPQPQSTYPSLHNPMPFCWTRKISRIALASKNPRRTRRLCCSARRACGVVRQRASRDKLGECTLRFAETRAND